MGASEFLIVLCSPNSAQSTWVNREVAWFKTHRDPLKILTVIVGGEPMASLIAGREAEECFPKTLLYRVGADLQPTAEIGEAPLAADARETGDGKRGAKLKLAAAMLGLGLDTLVNRDDRRRAQRRRVVMAGMAASIAVLGGLSVYAFNQRDAAVAARNDAVAARKDAEFQKTEAQDLVEFMLTDLRQRLDAVGRLDILDAVAKRLDESYARQDLSKLDPDALGRRARVQLLLGEVDNTRGNLDAALAQYKKAAATTEELLKRNPGKAQQIFDHAQSVFWVGYIAWQRGDAAEAKKYFTQYKDYADQLVAIDPENEDWLAEVDYANSNLGTLAMDRGEAAEAEAYFEKSLEVSSRLAASHPEDSERLASLGQSFAWLADSLHRQVKLRAARSARLSEIGLYTKWLDEQPSDVKILGAMSVARYRLAQIELAAGNLGTAREQVVLAASLADQRIDADPDSTEAADRASVAYSLLGEIDYYLGRIDEARVSLLRAIRLAERLIVIDEEVPLWRGFDLAQPTLLMAKISAANSEVRATSSLLNNMLKLQRSLVEKGVPHPTITKVYCDALAQRAITEKEQEVSWNSIITLLAPTIGRQLPDAQVLLAKAYLHIGAADKAREITSRLYSAGFRHPEFLELLEEFPDLKTAAIAGAAAQ